ncbi:MAG: DegV family protein [Propionibacteriaceae bacterium]
MGRTAVVTDSTASLRAEQAGERDIAVVPLQVVIDGESRPESPTGASADVVANALRAGSTVSTSRPAPEAFGELFARLADEGYTEVVAAHLSGAMSGTFDAASRAAREAPIPVTVVDTGTIAMGMGYAVLSGAEWAAGGAAADVVAESIRARAAASETYFYVHTLEYLRRGGRIGRAGALLGSALAMKPLLRMVDGVVAPHERVRTESRALARLQALAVEAAGAAQSDLVDVAVHHLDAADTADRIAEEIAAAVDHPTEVGIYELSAVLGVHVGPGTVGVVVSPRPS